MSRDLRIKFKFELVIERTICCNDPEVGAEAAQREILVESAGFLGGVDGRGARPCTVQVEDAHSREILLVKQDGVVVVRKSRPAPLIDVLA